MISKDYKIKYKVLIVFLIVSFIVTCFNTGSYKKAKASEFNEYISACRSVPYGSGFRI